MTISLRPTNFEDIKFLNEIRGKELPKLHNSRLKQQEEGKAAYLIAFQDGKPVGHIFVVFDGTEEYHNSPTLQDLYVSEELRGQHIGSEIISETEKYLKDIGYKEICLDVETREDGLRRFYEKQEFKQKSGPHKQKWTEKDSGEEIKAEVFHLEKKIK